MSLALSHVTFGYAARPVLRDCSARFEPGRLTALVGPNGSGKSTMLRLLASLRCAETGELRLDGQALESLSHEQRAKRLAYVPQQSSVAFDYTCAQIVAMGAYAAGRAESAPEVDAALDRVGLRDRASDPFLTLSAGQQQRVTLARALAQLGAGEPGSKFLLADEPVSAMDPRHAVHALGIMRELTTKGIGVVCVLHDLSMVLRACDDVVMLGEDGTVLASGSVRTTLTAERLHTLFGTTFDQLATASGEIAGFVPAAG